MTMHILASGHRSSLLESQQRANRGGTKIAFFVRKVALRVIEMSRAIISATAMTWMLALSFEAVAQDQLYVNDLAIPSAGEPAPFPGDVTVPLDSLGTDVGSTIAAGSAFLKEYSSNVRTIRGARDIAIYRDAAPAVVLVVTKDVIGSGSLLDNKTILTNWHVVKGYRQVNVIFKPTDPFGKLSNDDLIAAEVIKMDPVRDLALLRPKALPSRPINPIKVAPQDNIEVGADVHAIGHPTGEVWTYTRGIVSQIRADYEWKGDPEDVQHRATVIQTQTPINPGNSGGPLLADDGQQVGVNAFVKADGQGLNFAISAKDVRAFLASPAKQIVENDCKPRVLFEGRNKDNTGFIKNISLKCDDRADIMILVPDDKQKAVMAFIDISRRNRVEGIVLDERRAGKWNTSLWDPRLDETFPLRGIHPDGALLPTTREPRCRPPSTPLKDFKCS
jgi:S1-C subfamily serine protease